VDASEESLHTSSTRLLLLDTERVWYFWKGGAFRAGAGGSDRQIDSTFSPDHSLLSSLAWSEKRRPDTRTRLGTEY